MHYQAFWLSKRGNTAEEYEDAFAADADRGCFAIADGATESSFAGAWARLLVEGFIHLPTDQSIAWETWLPPLQQRWAAEASGRPLPWYAEAKLEQGAFATFLGLVVVAALPGNPWFAEAVGDSCLFQIRNDGLRTPFPITRSEEFGSEPWLVGSRSSASEVQEKKAVEAAGDWQPGDRFWLMTDALAQWFLRQFEAGKTPWRTLERVLSEPNGAEAFAGWIGELRDEQELRNDDVTLVAVCL